MLNKSKVFFNWSSGKDSAFALFKMIQHHKIDLLFTVINAGNKRISMHGVHENILKNQAESIGLPLRICYIPATPTMDEYNTIMAKELNRLKKRGFSETVFGDIFLDDLRIYRETQLKKSEIKAHFPLWKKNTKELILEFIQLGFKTCIVSANAKWFSKEFVGQTITKELIEGLPEDVDPCGENGEFHTFCYDGPIFKNPITLKIGEKVLRDYPKPNKATEKISYWFCDLLA